MVGRNLPVTRPAVSNNYVINDCLLDSGSKKKVSGRVLDVIAVCGVRAESRKIIC